MIVTVNKNALNLHLSQVVYLYIFLQVEEILWKVDDEVRSQRLPRYTVPMDEQEEFESVKLWRHVSDAIDKEDQHAATEQKSILEEAQRAGARERKADEQAWVPRFFELVSPPQ